MKSVEGRLVLITGGASGIGRLVAFDFARRGGKVVVWDLSQQAIDNIVEEGRKEGLEISGGICDVSDRLAVYGCAEELMRKAGPVDILVNNAGIVNGKTLLDTSDERIGKIMNVNSLSLFWTAKAFLPSMLERNTGHIVTISSAAGIVGISGLADYCASKFAAFGFNESIRMEMRRLRSKVRTTVVCPFFIDTGMFNGVKTRFPLLLPILKPSYAASKIVKAVLKNRKCLIMPRFVCSVFFLRLLPVSVFDFIADFMGVNRSMDSFRGRS
ncbi:MAG: SDR family oxidoreductase [Treponema sp.]|jgi:all-trans-retinol dehydrogenase (NAD+)|nr:SDR family oxidoreductase [Treponema sp.]